MKDFKLSDIESQLNHINTLIKNGRMEDASSHISSFILNELSASEFTSLIAKNKKDYQLSTLSIIIKEACSLFEKKRENIENEFEQQRKFAKEQLQNIDSEYDWKLKKTDEDEKNLNGNPFCQDEYLIAKQKYIEVRREIEKEKEPYERLKYLTCNKYFEIIKLLDTAIKPYTQTQDVDINPVFTEGENAGYFDENTVSVLYRNMCNKKNKSHLDFNNEKEFFQWINLECTPKDTKSKIRDVPFEKRYALISCLSERAKSAEIEESWLKKVAVKLGVKRNTINSHSNNGDKTDIRKWLNGENGDFDLFSK